MPQGCRDSAGQLERERKCEYAPCDCLLPDERRCIDDSNIPFPQVQGVADVEELFLSVKLECVQGFGPRKVRKFKSSGRRAAVVVQHATEALLSLNLPCPSEIAGPRVDDPVSQALVIPLCVIMRHELVNRFA
jgi:hypothetical protein